MAHEIGTALGAKHRTRSTAAKSCAGISAFAMLQQNQPDQAQGDYDLHRD